MDNPEPRAQYLNAVLRQIDRSLLRIPRFQRHFVWGERDVLELLGSIEKGYPIGSILTWKVDQASDYFSGYREEPFPAADEEISNFEVILDGAQRLSSLYGCLRAPGSKPVYRVAYDLRDHEFVHVSDDQAGVDWLVPMDAIFDSRRFLAVQAKVAELPDGEDCLRAALDLYSTFQDYQIPIISLSSAVLEDVVEVFRRVNSSGTPLSSVDFVRALTWRSSFDLEETFVDFEDRYEGAPLAELTEDFLVKCLAITANLSLDSRDIIHLRDLAAREGALTSEVDAMRAALDRMAEFLTRFDIARMQEVPYEVQRLLLFALMHADSSIDDEQLTRWFWRSTFAEEHQSKPESYVSRLIREIREGNPTAALEVHKPVESDLLAERARRSGSAVSTGFDLLLRHTGALSLLSGTPVAEGEPAHGLLYSRSQLIEPGDVDRGSTPLANLVQLTKQDAAEWRRLRVEHSLEELFALCDERTDNAEAIWRTQSVVPGANTSPAEYLRARSRSLLSRVLPELGEDEPPNREG